MITDKCLIRKNDKVKIIAGKDKGKISRVLKVILKKNKNNNRKKNNNRVLVENINMVKHHVKPNAKNRQGGIIEKETSICSSNVMLMCSKCMSAVKIKIQILEDGNKTRICGKCSEIIDN
ncbi:MAG: 50S ribosomal protein L24 [Desulfobacterales bacterium]|nr:50S ribosomal protein L24 [Desulfobacterales bacterium]